MTPTAKGMAKISVVANGVEVVGCPSLAITAECSAVTGSKAVRSDTAETVGSAEVPGVVGSRISEAAVAPSAPDGLSPTGLQSHIEPSSSSTDPIPVSSGSVPVVT